MRTTRPPRGPARASARGGFTLLELVLAMTALALVVAICYAAFHLGIRAVERGEVAVVGAQRLRVATDVLIRQIKSAVPYAARNQDEDIYPFFFGGATWITFVTATGLEGGGALTRISYQVTDDPPRLMVTESPFFSPDQLGREAVDKAGEHAAVLLEGFQDLRFEYMMSDGIDTEWRAEWNSHEEEALPAAVRVLVDGIPGLEVERWGQEIPVMTAQYGDNGNELSDQAEEDAALGAEAEDEDEDEPVPPGTKPPPEDPEDDE